MQSYLCPSSSLFISFLFLGDEGRRKIILFTLPLPLALLRKLQKQLARVISVESRSAYERAMTVNPSQHPGCFVRDGAIVIVLFI